MIRVVIADDQELVRAGLRAILSAAGDVEVVGEAPDGAAAIALVGREAPDVVLMDIRMPVLDGISATARIASSSPSRVVILTTFDTEEHVFAALRSGASGFLLKDGPAESLIQAVRTVSDGGALLSPAVTRRLISDVVRRGRPQPSAASALSLLTERESAVLRAVAAGLSNAEVGAELHLAESTVKTHVGSMLAKLQLRDRVQAVVFAYESGLVTPGGG